MVLRTQLTDVKGVGEATAANLVGVGINSVEALIAASTEEVSACPGFGLARVDAVKRAAYELLLASTREEQTAVPPESVKRGHEKTVSKEPRSKKENPKMAKKKTRSKKKAKKAEQKKAKKAAMKKAKAKAKAKKKTKSKLKTKKAKKVKKAKKAKKK